MKFYTSCGKKYAEISNMDMADVCYKKAAEFQKSVTSSEKRSDHSSRAVAKAKFDLLLGRAACAWDGGDHSTANVLINQAREYVPVLPEEADLLASIQYNFGLFLYQAKDAVHALEWLSKSLETRAISPKHLMNHEKQSKTARLAGVCLLALNRFDEARVMMSKAEKVFHNSVGAYLLLKIAVVTRASNAKELLSNILKDPESSLEVCMAATALLADAQKPVEALNGYKAIFDRFSSDSESILSTVGPRYFDALAAVGRLPEAMKLLNDCFDMIVLKSQQLPNNSTLVEAHSSGVLRHYQLWTSKALSTGCALANRKDFISATMMLDKALCIAANMREFINQNPYSPRLKKDDPIEENEPVICRLLASCAIAYISRIKDHEKRGIQETQAEQLSEKRKEKPSLEEIVKIAIEKAKRARDLDRDDFSARLLLFRAYLLHGRPDLAAAEMQKAGAEFSYFDAGSLAEAAFSAHKTGDSEAELAALSCILRLPVASLQKNLKESSNKPHPGFFGSVFVSYITILINKDPNASKTNESSDEPANGEMISFENCQISTESLPKLHSAMEAGLQGIRGLSPETAFGKDADQIETSLKFLADVCWNCGRQAGLLDLKDQWASFFDMCFELNTLRPESEEVNYSMLVSCLMSATSFLERDDKAKDMIKIAEKRLLSAKPLLESVQRESKQLKSIAIILQAKCFIGTGDDDGLACCADTMCRDLSIDPKFLEQLAGLCLDVTSSSESRDFEISAHRNQLASSLRHCAVDRRLSGPEVNLADVAITLRELIVSECARGELLNQTVQAFSKAIGLVKEKTELYPIEERRWLTAFAWDRALMLGRTERLAEAMHWVQFAIDIASTDVTLSSFVPRFVEFRNSIQSTSS